MAAVNNHPSGLFKTSKVFHIVGIGVVLTGHIVEGAAKPGDAIQIQTKALWQSWQINAVECVDYASSEAETGLIFDTADPELHSNLQSILGQTVTLVNMT